MPRAASSSTSLAESTECMRLTRGTTIFALRTVDPRSGTALPDDRLKIGSGFFYPLHYSLTVEWKSLGYWIVGFAALMMLVALVTGADACPAVGACVDVLRNQWIGPTHRRREIEVIALTEANLAAEHAEHEAGDGDPRLGDSELALQALDRRAPLAGRRFGS